MKASEIKAIHRQTQVAGVSTWYGTLDGRRRKVELQEFGGRLLLVGCLYAGHEQILRFEAPLIEVMKRIGPLSQR